MIPVEQAPRDRPRAHARACAAEEVAARRRARPRARRGRARGRRHAALRPLGHGRLRACAPPTWRRRRSRSRSRARSAPASSPSAPLRAGPGRADHDGRAGAARAPTAVQPVEKTRAARRRPPRGDPRAGGRRARTSRAQGSEVPRRRRRARARATRSIPPRSPCWPRWARRRVRVGRRPTVSVLVDRRRARRRLGHAAAAAASATATATRSLAQARWAGAEVRSLGVVPDQAERIAEAVRAGLRVGRAASSRAASRRAPSTSSRTCWRASTSACSSRKVAIKPGRAAGLRPPRRQAGLRPARQPGLGPGHLRRVRARRAAAHAGRARGVAARGRGRAAGGRAATAPAAEPPARARPLRGRPARGAAACARRARRTSWPTRAPTRSSSSTPRARRREAGETAPALLLGNFLERDGAAVGSSARRARATLGPRAGAARMVDVSAKPVTAREAVARGPHPRSRPRPCASRARAGCRKGGVAEVARLAGVLAAKRTARRDPALPSAAAHPRGRGRRRRAATASTIEARVAHRGAHGRGDGGAARGRRGRAHRLRHGEGRGQGDDHRRHPPGAQDRRPQRRRTGRAEAPAQIRGAGFLRSAASSLRPFAASASALRASPAPVVDVGQHVVPERRDLRARCASSPRVARSAAASSRPAPSSSRAR